MNKKNFTILLYHGVTKFKPTGVENFSRKHILADDFEKQMVYLKNNYKLISMDELLYLHDNSHQVEKKINYAAVTFDDGFKNNFSVAAPILSKHKIPAMFYITTGLIGTKKLFWVDKIENYVNKANVDNFKLRLNINRISFKIGSLEQKIKSIKKIKSYCKLISREDKNRIINELKVATKYKSASKISKNYEVLNWNELRHMSKNKLFSFGAHTVDHEILSYLNKSDMMHQITESVVFLGKKLNIEIKHFSYPEGQKRHYNKTIIKFLKEIGILCSPSAVKGLNSLNDDLFNLKRIMVGFDGQKFPRLRK
tara:strand:- start:171 stop:1100 length:930 start_codon:yes stop_codon:yes gene_type:complete